MLRPNPLRVPREAEYLLTAVLACVATAPAAAWGYQPEVFAPPALGPLDPAPPAPEVDPGPTVQAQVLVDQRMMEELWRRLEATEAELAELREQVANQDEESEDEFSADGCGDTVEEPIAAESAKFPPLAGHLMYNRWNIGPMEFSRVGDEVLE